MQFQKDKKATIQALIDFGSDVNTMTLAYTKKLGLQTQKTNIGAQKTDSLLFKTYKMVIAIFLIKNKVVRPGSSKKLSY